MNDTLELDLDSKDQITPEKFWQLADDLFYTKVFYDVNADSYFTKQFKKCTRLDAAVERTLKDFRSSGCSILSDSNYEELDECTEDEINTLLVSYLTLVTRYADQLMLDLGEDDFYTSVATYLLDFKYYQLHVDFCIRKMLSLLAFTVKRNLHNLNLDVDALSNEIKDEVNNNIAINECFIKTIGYIFYKHYSSYREELLIILSEYRGFITLMDVIQNYCAITETSLDNSDPYGKDYRNYFIMLFDLCSEFSIDKEQLNYINFQTICGLFNQLKVLTESENELNFLKFRLLLVLNEQFIGIYGTKDEESHNMVLSSMRQDKDLKLFQRFFQLLVLNLNRSSDHIDQILMMKFLYLVFCHESTINLVYLNDLKVIIDIIIRQLYDLAPIQHEYLINIFIRVLYQMLSSKKLKMHPYKMSELHDVLIYLEDGEQVGENTKDLAHKCLKGQFFMNRNYSDPQTVGRSNLESVRLPTHNHSENNISVNNKDNGGSTAKNWRPNQRLSLKITASCPDLTKVRIPPPPPPRSRGSQHLQRTSTNSSISSESSQRSKPPPPPPPRDQQS